MLDGIDEIFTIRPPVRRVNAELRTTFVGHHVTATFELRGGGVKATARRVERSESLDDAEHSSILAMLWPMFFAEIVVGSWAESPEDLRRFLTRRHV
jgi:hypothetical protein